MSKRPKVVGKRTGPLTSGYTYTPSRFGVTNQAAAGEIRLLAGFPEVVFSEAAWRTMRSYIDAVDTEIGWLGIVTRTGNEFFVESVYLAEQEVSGAQTLITEAGFNRLMVELLAETASDPIAARALVDDAADSDALEAVMAELMDGYGCDMESAMTRGNTLRFWGHSHVNMGVGPSGTDDTAMESFHDQRFSYMLRGIFNKKGNVRIDLFDYDRGVMVLNISHRVRWEKTSDEKAIIAEIARKVTEKEYPAYTGNRRSNLYALEGYRDLTDFAELDQENGDFEEAFELDGPAIRQLLAACDAIGASPMTALRQAGLAVDDVGNVCRAACGTIVLAGMFESLLTET